MLDRSSLFARAMVVGDLSYVGDGSGYYTNGVYPIRGGDVTKVVPSGGTVHP